MSPERSVPRRDDLVAKLTPDQALIVVRRLFQEGGEIQTAVLREAENLLADVDVEGVAGDVFATLDGIDVQDCWDRAGPHRDGYTSPDEAACELVDGALQPFFEQAAKYHELGMTSQETVYCMGVILGIYRYNGESKSEFKAWAQDIPLDNAGDLLRKWKKRNGDIKAACEMDDFIVRSCPRWESYLVKGGT